MIDRTIAITGSLNPKRRTRTIIRWFKLKSLRFDSSSSDNADWILPMKEQESRNHTPANELKEIKHQSIWVSKITKFIGKNHQSNWWTILINDFSHQQDTSHRIKNSNFEKIAMPIGLSKMSLIKHGQSNHWIELMKLFELFN